MVVRNVIKIYRIYSERAKTCRNGLLGVIYLYFLNRIPYTFTTAQLANDKWYKMQWFSYHKAVLSLFRGKACLTFCLQNLQMHVAFLRHDSSYQGTEIITQLSRQCAGSSQKQLFPWQSCQSLSLTNKKGPSIRPREHVTGGALSSVLLYWSSLVSGFLNRHSVPSTSEIPPSPISRDDSLQLLRSRRGALGAFDNSVITANAIYPFLKVLLWAKEHESDWFSFFTALYN